MVIPGRREAASPEPITPPVRCNAGSTKSHLPGLWVPGSLATLGPGMTIRSFGFVLRAPADFEILAVPGRHVTKPGERREHACDRRFQRLRPAESGGDA